MMLKTLILVLRGRPLLDLYLGEWRQVGRSRNIINIGGVCTLSAAFDGGCQAFYVSVSAELWPSNFLRPPVVHSAFLPNIKPTVLTCLFFPSLLLLFILLLLHRLRYFLPPLQYLVAS